MSKPITNLMLGKLEQSISNINDTSNEIKELSIAMADKIENEGRIIFIGAGISSEIAEIIIDELWFNFQIRKGKFIALTSARHYEGMSESWKELEEVSSTSVFELEELGLQQDDMIIGLSASGKTEYVLAGLRYAKSIGCKTAMITDIHNEKIEDICDYLINTKMGSPSIIGLNAATGGTIQKIMLDLLIYNAMVFSGRIYKESLAFMIPVSSKIKEYCIETLIKLFGFDREEAIKSLESADKHLEIAILNQELGTSNEESRKILEENNFNLNKCLAK